MRAREIAARALLTQAMTASVNSFRSALQSRWRELMGATNPAEAAEGTIRQRFWNRKPLPANVVHGSATPEDAKREIALIFAHARLS